MKKQMKIWVLSLVAAVVMTACGTTSTIPISGRKQHLLVSDAQVLSLSNQQYRSYMQKATPSTNVANTAMVKRVGQRLANAVETYLREHGAADDLKNFAWEFNLVRDNQANAFCMPGGKIVVYEGLLPFTRDEASLAIVLGHEIAHAVARHSAEQMSQKLKAQYGAQAFNILLGTATNDQTLQQLGSMAFGFGANSTLRKFSRSHESEADYMGLIFAAMAGYDPTVAVNFWQRMAAGNQNRVPEFFSDHPSDAKRIANIQRELPEAMKYYRAAAPQVKSNKPQPVKTMRASNFKRSTPRRR